MRKGNKNLAVLPESGNLVSSAACKVVAFGHWGFKSLLRHVSNHKEMQCPTG